MIKREIMSYDFDGGRLEHRIECGTNCLVYQTLTNGKYLNVEVKDVYLPIEAKKKVVALGRRIWTFDQPYMEHYYADFSHTDARIGDDNKLKYHSLHIYMKVQYNKLTKKTFMSLLADDHVLHMRPFSFSSTEVLVMRKEALAYANERLGLDIFWEG